MTDADINGETMIPKAAVAPSEGEEKTPPPESMWNDTASNEGEAQADNKPLSVSELTQLAKDDAEAMKETTADTEIEVQEEEMEEGGETQTVSEQQLNNMQNEEDKADYIPSHAESPRKKRSRSRSPTTLSTRKRLIAARREETRPLHRRSEWQEPAREDGLTLYERHRFPRPVISGTVTCPIKAVLQQFRCVICLGCITNARLVVECLHRFCEDCIEKAMRLGGNNVCPICRVVIPSRRSLVPDPNMDAMVEALLGHRRRVEVSRDNYAERTNTLQEEEVHRSKAVTLQRAIFRKRQEESSRASVNHFRASPRVLTARQKQQQEDEQDLRRSQEMMSTDALDLALFRHPDETQLDKLQLPYIRLAETATVETLKIFLHKKLGIICKSITRTIDLGYLTDKGQYVLLTDWMTLTAVSQLFGKNTDAVGDASRVQLLYRLAQDKGMRN